MSNSIHVIAILIILLALGGFIYLDRKNNKANPNYPSLLISIGIAFTFLGVALGLKDFNTDDPTASLGALVDGIKTAFWGSLAGVVASIAIKLHALIGLKENHADQIYDEQAQKFYQQHSDLLENSLYLERIHNSLNSNNDALIDAIHNFGLELDEKNKSNMQELLKSINTSLNGIEQIQRSTQGYIAGEISELRTEFVLFAQKQAEQNTEIFIQALETAIQKFNENLSDGLGENFKHLNQSIDRLVLWQSNYSEHVEQQTEKYTEMVDQIEKVKNDFSALVSNTNTFQTVIHQIESSLLSIDHKNTEFNKRIESFYGALDSKVVDIENTRQIIDKALSSVEAQMQNTKQMTQQIFSEINQYIESTHSNSLNSQKQTSQQVQQLTSQMKTSFEQTQKQLNDGLTTIENKLQHTLNQSLVTLAQQLGSLSTKFANDYEPITVNLKKVIDSLDKGVK